MDNFKYISTNSLDLISLHDCILEAAEIKGSNLIWQMSNIDVLPEHPLNLCSTPKCTGYAYLTFCNFTISNAIKNHGVECSPDKGESVGESKIESYNETRSESGVLDLLADLEILYCDKNDEGQYSYHFMANKYGELFIVEFDVSFTTVVISWNEFIRDSWFAENYAKKQDPKS